MRVQIESPRASISECNKYRGVTERGQNLLEDIVHLRILSYLRYQVRHEPVRKHVPAAQETASN